MRKNSQVAIVVDVNQRLSNCYQPKPWARLVYFRFRFFSRNQTLRDRSAVCFWNPSCDYNSRRHCDNASTSPPLVPG